MISWRGEKFRFPPLGSVPQSLVIAEGVENLVAKRLGLGEPVWHRTSRRFNTLLNEHLVQVLSLRRRGGEPDARFTFVKRSVLGVRISGEY